jgi:2-dehydropantoate 2-reductase
MSVLVVGAGAAGGYLGAQLVTAGRDVRFLVHPGTLARLNAHGLRVRGSGGVSSIPVNAVTASELHGSADVVILGVRSDVVASAVDDIRGVITPDTRVVPVINGVAHLSVLTAAFGDTVVLGGTARLATSMEADGTIHEVAPGVALEVGQLDGGTSAALDRVVAELSVANVAVRVRPDVRTAMWEKFAMITSTAVLTCLAGDVVGVIARTPGGPALGRRVASEVSAVAAAEGHPLSDAALAALIGILTDAGSSMAPSMFRDLAAHRHVEVSVLAELAGLARQHQIDTPLLDAALVVIAVHSS